MGEVTEKIYCCDRGDNDNALAAAILANGNNRRDDWGPMAAMMGGGMNNPFAYLMFLAFTRNGGFGNGNNNVALEAIRTQMQDNQNSSLIMSALGDGFNRNDFALSQLAQNLNVDFNTLQKCCCDVQAAIREVGGAVGFSAEKVINAGNLGDCRIIEALKDCCCQTQRQIADFRADIQLQNCKDTAEIRNGQRDLGFAITQGFSSVAFQAQQDKCDILRAGQDNTQRIIDTLNNHWNDEKSLQIQDLKFQLSQKEQNEKFAAMLYGSRNGGGRGCNDNCGRCGCGCGCDQ